MLSNYVAPILTAAVGPKQLQEILQSLSSIENLDPSQKEAVRNGFAGGYNKQMQLLTGFSAAALLASFLLWERKPRKVG